MSSNFRGMRRFFPLLLLTEIKDYPHARHDSSKRDRLYSQDVNSPPPPVKRKLKRKFVPRGPTISLSGEENQPRLIRKTSTLVTKMKGNSSQTDQPHSQGFSPPTRRRAEKTLASADHVIFKHPEKLGVIK